MYETYRMLGSAHEADLEREARGRRLAAKLPRRATGRLVALALVLVGVLVAIVVVTAGS